MALKISFPDRTDGICEDAYIIADLTLDNKTKTGRLELAVWKAKGYREAGKSKINNVDFHIGEVEIWEKDEEDNNLYINSLAWDDFSWKSGADVYSKIKTLKVFVAGEIIDLSNSIDC